MFCGALVLSTLEHSLPQYSQPDAIRKTLYALSRVLSLGISKNHIGRHTSRLIFSDHIGNGLLNVHCRWTGEGIKLLFFATASHIQHSAWQLEWLPGKDCIRVYDVHQEHIGKLTFRRRSAAEFVLSFAEMGHQEIAIIARYSYFQRTMNLLMQFFPIRRTKPRSWIGHPSQLLVITDKKKGADASAKLQGNVFKPEYSISGLEQGLGNKDPRLLLSALACLVFGYSCHTSAPELQV